MRLNSVDSAASFYNVSIPTSNLTYQNLFDSNEFSSDLDYAHLGFSVLADMDANDTAFVRVYQSGGTAQTDVNGDNAMTFFTGVLVC